MTDNALLKSSLLQTIIDLQSIQVRAICIEALSKHSFLKDDLEVILTTLQNLKAASSAKRVSNHPNRNFDGGG